MVDVERMDLLRDRKLIRAGVTGPLVVASLGGYHEEVGASRAEQHRSNNCPSHGRG